ncbi:hypothetical protein [Rummeliibacillus stabekisii]|uniref:hypothetical protein n=1 Tax=Rummeliibacillus stabekisii TaxID=241244 RepID=UPI0037190401
MKFFDAKKGILNSIKKFGKEEFDTVRIERNLIHFFRGEEVKTWSEFKESIKTLIEFLLELTDRLPDYETEYGYLNGNDTELRRYIYDKKRSWFEYKFNHQQH